MKGSELRIGNFVQLDSNTIVPIRGGGINAIETGALMCHPIPLTEEWPARLGLSLYNEACDGNEYEIYIGDHTTFNVIIYKHSQDKFPANAYMKRWGDIMNLRKIQHVHQLQNLYFALTGEELTINK